MHLLPYFKNIKIKVLLHCNNSVAHNVSLLLSPENTNDNESEGHQTHKYHVLFLSMKKTEAKAGPHTYHHFHTIAG